MQNDCIREAHSSDIAAVMKLTQDGIAHMRALGLDQWDEIYPHESDFTQDVAEQTLFVFEQDGAILACGVLNDFQDPRYAGAEWRLQETPIAVIHRLIVHPNAQGRGIAKQMMTFLEVKAREKGYKSIRLDAFTKNPTAVGLYEKLGYANIGQIRLRKGQFVCFEKKVENESA